MVGILDCLQYDNSLHKHSSSHPEMFFKGVLQICRKFTAEQSCKSVVSIKLHCSFIEITLFRCSGYKIIKAKYELHHPPWKKVNPTFVAKLLWKLHYIELPLQAILKKMLSSPWTLGRGGQYGCFCTVIRKKYAIY